MKRSLPSSDSPVESNTHQDNLNVLSSQSIHESDMGNKVQNSDSSFTNKQSYNHRFRHDGANADQVVRLGDDVAITSSDLEDINSTQVDGSLLNRSQTNLSTLAHPADSAVVSQSTTIGSPSLLPTPTTSVTGQPIQSPPAHAFTSFAYQNPFASLAAKNAATEASAASITSFNSSLSSMSSLPPPPFNGEKTDLPPSQPSTTTATFTAPATTSNAFASSSFSSFTSINPFAEFSAPIKTSSASVATPSSSFSSSIPTPTSPSTINTTTTPNTSSTSTTSTFGGFSAFGGTGTGFSAFGSTSTKPSGFGSLAASTAIGIGSASPFSGFGSVQTAPSTSTTTTSTTTSTQDETNQDGDEDEQESKNIDECAVAHVDHNVSAILQKQDQLQLGEEGEENVHGVEVRLYQLLWVEVKPDTAPTQAAFGTVTINDDSTASVATKDEMTKEPIKIQKYVERGKARVHINVTLATNATRIVARHITKGSLLINDYIYKNTTNVVPLDGDKNLRLTTVSTDPLTKTPKITTYLFKFPNNEQGAEFKKIITQCQDKMAK